MKYPPRRAGTCGCGYLAAFLALLLVVSLQIQYHHLKVDLGRSDFDTATATQQQQQQRRREGDGRRGGSAGRWSRKTGAEGLPRGIVETSSDMYLRPLWGSAGATTQTSAKSKNDSYKALLAMAVGIEQMQNVDTMARKFLNESYTVMLFHYDGNVDGWRGLEWSDKAIHVLAPNQTKWWFAKRFLHPSVVAIYDFIFLWDEDLGVEKFDPRRYLDIMVSEGLEITQPALDPDLSTDIHHRITIRNKMTKVHRRVYDNRSSMNCSDDSKGPPCTGWVEGMAPVFSRAAWKCVWHLIQVVLPQTGGSNKAGFRLVYSNTKGDFCLDGVFNVISYDVVPKIQSTLLDLDFKIVIADESHFMKNAQAKRTIASLPVLQKAEYVILLSGTPALSRPIELFTQLQALYPNVYKNVSEYGSRYCQGGFFGMYQGASNHEELHNLMKATVMIRRLKKDVLSELPVKRRQQVFMDLSEKEIKPIRALFRELEAVKINIQSCDSQETMDSLKFAQKNIINKIYNDSAAAKIPAVLDYLGTVIEADCKFLIFAHHQPMIDAIHQHLLKKKVKCIRIDGQTPVAVRQNLVTDFQSKDDIKAAVLSIKAGGVGLTLTAASTVIFAELSWTPGDIIQAEDRAHRIGQVSSVNIYYLLANETVDDIIWDVVQGKLENLGQMLDGEEKTLAVSQSETRPRPSKQKTLDSFLKRGSTSTETQPSPKSRRF